MQAARVGAAQPQAGRLVKRLRSLNPAWSVSQREAHWIAEYQARLLLAEAGVAAPPVPETVVTELDGVNVYPLADMPVNGLLAASKPNSRGGDILIDSTLPPAERRVTLMRELKHVIDGGHTTKLRQAGSQTDDDGLCTDFAMNVLTPAPWLRADWQAGRRNVRALAERYQVPAEAMRHRLQTLGLLKRTSESHGHRIGCQWYPNEHVQGKRSLR
jgi:Zn-dependent peptidase ImmA (M78 family)